MNRKIIKEIFIIILLILVIMFVMGILFYDVIPFKEDITSVEYTPDEKVLQAVEEIQGNKNQVTTNEEALLKSYSIDKDDLTIYANQKFYESGKKDPFAESSEPVEEVVRTETTEGIQNNSHNSNPVIIEDTEDVKNAINPSNTNEENKNVQETKSVKENKVKEEKVKTEKEDPNSVGTFFEKKNSK